jgi:hypothetical protein
MQNGHPQGFGAPGSLVGAGGNASSKVAMPVSFRDANCEAKEAEPVVPIEPDHPSVLSSNSSRRLFNA